MNTAEQYIPLLRALLQRLFRRRKFVSSRSEFFRKSADCPVYATLEVIADRPECIDLKLSCRHQLIEQITGQFCRENPLAQKATLQFSLYEISGSEINFFPLENQEDVCRYAEILADFMEAYGFHFLEKIGSLKNIDQMLNNSPKSSCQYAEDSRSRIYRGITAAKLANNPQFLTLSEIYGAQLFEENFEPDEVCLFDKLMTFLLCCSFN